LSRILKINFFEKRRLLYNNLDQTIYFLPDKFKSSNYRVFLDNLMFNKYALEHLYIISLRYTRFYKLYKHIHKQSLNDLLFLNLNLDQNISTSFKQLINNITISTLTEYKNTKLKYKLIIPDLPNIKYCWGYYLALDTIPSLDIKYTNLDNSTTNILETMFCLKQILSLTVLYKIYN
jgi:hypothetical protein